MELQANALSSPGAAFGRQLKIRAEVTDPPGPGAGTNVEDSGCPPYKHAGLSADHLNIHYRT